MYLIIFAICLVASTVGGICGIGGGVIIKPLVDALGIMNVSAISFLSGLTVLSMSIISILKMRKEKIVDLKIGSFLALGAVLGGILGNNVFQILKQYVGNDNLVGAAQSVTLAVVTLLTFVYQRFLREQIPSYTVRNPAGIVLIGVLMGSMSSFLGIGGGPINLAILYFAFSMDTKKAAANSLYIIMISQLASLLTACFQKTIPEFNVVYLMEMVCAGMLGGFLGSKINKRISETTTDRLFSGLLCVIVVICCYNVWRFVSFI